MSECDSEALIMRKPWPTKGCCTIKKLDIKFISWIPFSQNNERYVCIVLKIYNKVYEYV